MKKVCPVRKVAVLPVVAVITDVQVCDVGDVWRKLLALLKDRQSSHPTHSPRANSHHTFCEPKEAFLTFLTFVGRHAVHQMLSCTF